MKKRQVQASILTDEFLTDPDRWGVTALVTDAAGRKFEVIHTVYRGDDATTSDLIAEVERAFIADEIPQGRIFPLAAA